MTYIFKPGRPLWWQWLTVLSVDAPLVAILWQALFAFVVDVRLPWHDPVLLGLGVWIIYAADRWIEGWRLSPEIVQTPRHLFYIRHRWPVFGIAVLAILATAIIAFIKLESHEFKASVVLLIPTLLYLFSHQLLHRHHPLRLPKEICIAVIFALGCALAPAVHAPDRLMLLCLPALLFCMLCFANCALISVWEKEVDARHGQTSIALQLGSGAILIRLLPWCVALTAVVAIPITGHPAIRSAAVCAAASGMLLGLLDLLHPRLGRIVSRAAVDLTLMTPVFVFLFR
jgi:4-hydroxybenzoate polyprenyltransferase